MTKIKYCGNCGIELVEGTYWKSRPHWCKKCEYERHKQWLETDSGKKWSKEYRSSGKKSLAIRKTVRKLKIEVLSHYGKNGKPICVRCGFDDIRALSIDHILGDGRKHRTKIGIQRGSQFYRWLRREGYPSRYQTL